MDQDKQMQYKIHAFQSPAPSEFCQNADEMRLDEDLSLKGSGFVERGSSQDKGLVVAAIIDNEFPQRVVHSLLNDVMKIVQEETSKNVIVYANQDISLPILVDSLNRNLVTYQNPKETDKLTRIQISVEETKEVMSQNINKLLERGERLDVLMQKSNDLSYASRKFLKDAKRTNSCCKY